MRLKDKVTLITGGGSGIGASVAKRFAGEGALIAIADVVPEGAKEVMDEIAKQGGKTIFTKVDVRKEDEVGAMIDQVVREFGRLDILINNAGVTRDNLSARMTEEEWDFVIDINLKGSFLCSRAAYRPMRKQKSGKIINTASVVVKGNMGQANYSSSKAGLIGLTRTLALEYARSNITVNCIAPGFIDTDMVKSLAPDKYRERVDSIKMNRIGTPGDVANCALFLASDLSEYVTGQVIGVDGGMLI